MQYLVLLNLLLTSNKGNAKQSSTQNLYRQLLITDHQKRWEVDKETKGRLWKGEWGTESLPPNKNRRENAGMYVRNGKQRGERRTGRAGRRARIREGCSQHHLTGERLISDSRCWRIESESDKRRERYIEEHQVVEETELRVSQHYWKVSREGNDGARCVRKNCWKVDETEYRMGR